MTTQAPSTETTCIHCRAKSETGTHGGCSKCGKVKYTTNGRREPNTGLRRSA